MMRNKIPSGFLLSLILSLALYQNVCAGDRSGSWNFSLLSSLDLIADPRSLTMGESFVATRGKLEAGLYNPAALASLRGTAVSYGRRDLTFFTGTEPYTLEAADVAMAFSFGTFGIQYHRFFSKGIETTPAFPEGTGRLITVSNSTYGLSFATRLNRSLEAGVGIKSYSPEAEGFSLNIQHPVLVDLGVIYHLPAFASEADHFRDTLAAGISVQNLGTDFRVEGDLVPLPRYLRAGFGYEFAMEPSDRNGLIPATISAALEYRNLPNNSQGGGSDFWGLGTEVALYEIVSVRVGAFVPGRTDFYGIKGEPGFRYGLGFSLPGNKIWAQTPLSLRFDYGLSPVNQSYSTFSTNSRLSSISLSVHYGS